MIKKNPKKIWKGKMAKIQKGLEMPEAPRRKTKYPWPDLEVGDSFEIDTNLGAAHTYARQASERYKKTFEARAYRGAVRIWRTK
jgi:hypothetical protein